MDANNLRSFFIEKARGDFSLIKEQIDRAKAARAWLILSTHDVCDNPSPFGCTPAFFESIVRYVRDLHVVVEPVATAFTRMHGA
jgi:hypothetical protein